MQRECSGDILSERIHVAVGVIVKGTQVLLSQRLAHQHMGGLWEFPGGKVEPGETLQQALERELYEELDIRPVTLRPLFGISHDYPGKRVALDICAVTEFRGTPWGKEGQEIRWVEREALGEYVFPRANRLIVECLQGQRDCPAIGSLSRG